MDKYESPFNSADAFEPVFFQLDESIKGALNAEDSDGLRRAIDQAKSQPVLETIDFRLHLRDFWLERKTDLALLGDPEQIHEPLDKAIAQFISTLDTDFDQLSEPYRVKEGILRTTLEEQPTTPARLMSELDGLSPERQLSFLAELTALKPVELSTPQQLLPWTWEWRDSIVELLWPLAQEYRQAGELSLSQGEAATTMNQVERHLNKLIQGAVHPTAV